MIKIITNIGQQVQIDGSPNKCPFCHEKITPNAMYGHKIGNDLEVFYYCPNQSCNKGFIGYHRCNGSNQFYNFTGHVTFGNVIDKTFSSTIENISENFTAIYNQAYFAEQNNLTEICGVGYRKALEFLIKDYLISNKPSETEKIEKKLLGACIAEHVDDARIKSVAKRAVWLGNDETHYIRKWDGKNLDDLKKLIDLTVHWIEMEALTSSFEDDMPE